MGSGDRPVKALREYLERNGIRVFEVPVPLQQFSGLSSLTNAFGPRILVNGREGFGRRHFTLLHEWAHLLYRHGSAVCNIPAETERRGATAERMADRFAVEFLLPAEAVTEDARRRLDGDFSMRPLARLAGRWRVSIQALGYRLEELHVLERGFTDKLLARETPPTFYVKGRRPQWRRQLGDVYVDKAVGAYRAGHISLSKLASLLGVPYRKVFDLFHQDAPL